MARAHLSPLWTIVSDGSLRNGGVEFITTGGKGGETLHQAYERITTCLRDRVNYDASWRCSTHMHLNMLDFTCNQVARFMLVYAACEPVLFELAGASRRSSNFCTPLADSLVFHKKLIARLYDDTVASRAASANTSKYTALNFQPLFGNSNVRPLGTIEFRGGRPMTTMEELLLQTNILLSIKEFVRSFSGTEEEMLVKLSEGVFNTVFQNGCAASLDTVRVDDLEACLIHSWLLLKSYQQGMTEQSSRPKRGGGLNPFPTDWGLTTGTTVEAPVARAVPRGRARAEQALGAMAQRINDAPYWTAATPTRGQVYTSVDYTSASFGSSMNAALWPRLHQHLGRLQSESVSRMEKAETMVSVLSDPAYRSRLSSMEAKKTAINWVLKPPLSGEVSPIGTILRAVMNKSQGGLNNTECLDASMNGANQPLLFDASVRVDYTSVIPSSSLERIAEWFHYPRGMLNNTAIWNTLLHSTVTLINKNVLVDTFERLGNTGAGAWRSCPDRISVLQAYYLFRICNVRSEDYVRPQDLPMYDGITQTLQVLLLHGLAFPVVHHTVQSDGMTIVRKLFIISTRNHTLGYGYGSEAVQNHQTHSPRLSPTTGHRVY